MADPEAASERRGSGGPNRINRLLTAKIKKDFAALTNLVMVRNDGISGAQNTEMRAELRAQGIKVQVVRNRLSMRAFKDMGLEEADQLFNGPTAIIEAEDPVVAAKVAAEFCKRFEKLSVIGGLVEGKVLSKQAVLALSKSKSRPELLAEVAGQVLSPGATLAAQFKGPGGHLAGVLKGLIEKLEKEAPDEAAA